MLKSISDLAKILKLRGVGLLTANAKHKDCEAGKDIGETGRLLHERKRLSEI
jgi:hypothetical protein